MGNVDNYTRSAHDELKAMRAERKAQAVRLKELAAQVKQEREAARGSKPTNTMLRLMLAWLKSRGELGNALIAIKESLVEAELREFKAWRDAQKAALAAKRKAKEDAARGAEAEAVKKGGK